MEIRECSIIRKFIDWKRDDINGCRKMNEQISLRRTEKGVWEE